MHAQSGSFERPNLHPFLRRTLLFRAPLDRRLWEPQQRKRSRKPVAHPSNGCCEANTDRRQLAEQLIGSLSSKLGLHVWTKSFVEHIKQLVRRKVAAVPEQPTPLITHFSKAVLNKKGQVIFDGIWPRTRGRRRQLNLEVGSGGGEWACAQARASKDSALGEQVWATLELRMDRVYDAFVQTVFYQIDNMCVMCGDAHHVLERHIAPNTFQRIVVNHPEPPTQTSRGPVKGLDNAHMLNKRFLMLCSIAMSPTGLLTILSDNLNYMRLLATSLGREELRATFESFEEMTEPLPGQPMTWRAFESVGPVCIYEGWPDMRCGFFASQSKGGVSYFDRLWSTGISRHSASTERYFICLRKAGVRRAAGGARKRVRPKNGGESTEEPGVEITLQSKRIERNKKKTKKKTDKKDNLNKKGSLSKK